MAEFVAIVGTGAAVLQISHALLKVSDILEEIRDASSEIELFQFETETSGRMLDMFHEIATNSIPYLNQRQKPQRRKLISSLVKLFNLAREKLESVAAAVETPSASTSARMRNWTIKLKWFINKTAITIARVLLERVKSSANLFINMITCEDLTRKLAELRNGESTAPAEELRHLQNRLRHVTEMTKKDMDSTKKAATSMEKFQSEHDVSKDLSESDLEDLQLVERAVQQEAIRVVPEQLFPKEGLKPEDFAAWENDNSAYRLSKENEILFRLIHNEDRRMAHLWNDLIDG